MIATAEDISRAIDAIPQHEFVRLRDFAENRVTRIGYGAAHGRTDDDLLQEAVTRLLEGTRHWDPAKVDIVMCLIGVMRSIASAWAGHRRRNASSPDYAVTESELITFGMAGQLASPFDGLKTTEMTVEEQAIANDGVAGRTAFADEIEASCAGDQNALKVLAAFQCGVDGATIQRDFCWTETEYRTTVRRIKRRAHKLSARRMEDNPHTKTDRSEKILDALADYIESAPGEELLDDARREGRDPEQIATHVKGVIVKAVKDHRHR